MRRLRLVLRSLYLGSGTLAHGFQLAFLAFDVAVIGFFLVLTFIDTQQGPRVVAAEITIGALLVVDFVVRLWISEDPLRHLVRPTTIADVIVIVSLLAPAFTQNAALLRVFRALRLLRSYRVLGVLRRINGWVRRNEEVIRSVVNLLVFIFIITAVVYVTQHDSNDEINNYVDALYFTVTTLTTTGFGDITLEGRVGELLAVVIMIFGISLFIRLVHTAFRSGKLRQPCPACGLQRHDPDAVHCKHCGRVVNIPSEGD